MPPDSPRPAPFSRQTAYGSFRLDRPSLIALDRALADRLIQAGRWEGGRGKTF